MAPYPIVTAYPPLGQLTILQPRQKHVRFTVLMEWNRARPDFPFELVLCYAPSSEASKHTSRWQSSPMKNAPNPAVVEQEDSFKSAFQVVLPTALLGSEHGEIVHFTIKYRVNDIAPWQWVQTQQGTSPGTLLVQTADSTTNEHLSTFLSLESGWQSTKMDGFPSTSIVYELQLQRFVPGSDTDQDEERLSTCSLGTVPGIIRYMAIIRLEPYWLGPRQGKDYFYLAEDAILCAFLTKSGRVVTILTMTGLDDTYSVIQSGENGEVVIAARCDSDKSVPFRAIVSIASTFDESCSAVMKHAATLANSQPLSADIAAQVSRSNNMETEFDAWLDGLVFCTWNALGQNLTQEKLLTALTSLSDNNVNISALLIDDNWQTIGPIPDHDYSDSFFRGFASIPCNTSVGPEGLPALIEKIKSSHPNVTDVGVWHALMGYWGGISPSGQIVKDYATSQVPAYLMGNVPATITSISQSSLPQFYDDFYKYLSSSGVTFVKTDVQHMLSTFRSRSSRLELTSAYQAAWTIAHNKHFNSKAISCMSQTPQTLFASLLQTHTPRILHRNSDDFYPEIPASQPWHIWTNAHNALFTQHLNVVPDWDMFQTSHLYSSYHAAARCISGGPITITDVPGEHDVDLIRRMTALDANGRSIALRPAVASAIRMFDEYTDGSILKVGSVTSPPRDKISTSSWRASLLGLWNIAERTESTLIHITEFKEVEAVSERVLVGSYRSGQFFGPFDAKPAADLIAEDTNRSADLVYVMLPVREWDILTAYPVFTPFPQRQDIEIAVVGLTDKISGAAGVVDVKVDTGAHDGAFNVAVELKALGKLGLCITTGLKVELDNLSVTLQGKGVQPENIELKIGEKDGMRIVSVDVESEWRRRNLFGAGQREITVEIEVRL